jgi:hypothetical protein
MTSKKTPRTDAEWDAWHAKQRRLASLSEAELKAEARAAEILRHRNARAKSTELRRKVPAAKRANVVALPSKPATPEIPSAAPEIGPNEAGVIAECALMPRAADRPSVVAQAITIARRLDDPAHDAATATNSRQLQALMKELQAPVKKMRTHLATVSAMSNRGRNMSNRGRKAAQ